MDPIRVAAVLLMLAGATLSDLRTRRVPNRYWVPFAAVAAMLWARDIAAGTASGQEALAALVLTGLLWAAFRARVFGGADAKGLMVMAWLWPELGTIWDGHTATAFDTMVNASLLVLVVPLVFTLRNLAAGRMAGAATFLAVPMAIDDAERRHVWPMERVRDGRVRRTLFQTPGIPMDDVYAALRRHGVREVWATPKVPFMLPLLVGAAVTAAWGNILLRMAV